MNPPTDSGHAAPPPPGGPPPPRTGGHYPGGRTRQFQRAEQQQQQQHQQSPPSVASPPPPPGPPPSSGGGGGGRHHHARTTSSPSSQQNSSSDQQHHHQTATVHHATFTDDPKFSSSTAHPQGGMMNNIEITTTSANNDDDDDDDADFVNSRQQRKLRSIRRAGSFMKLSTLSEQIESWFFTDKSVHAQWAKFAESVHALKLVGAADDDNTHATATSTSTNGTATDGGDDLLLAANLGAQEKHQEFCELFEAQLEAMLDARNVTLEQFSERMRLDKEEEERDGSHFYRWLEVIEFPSFVSLIAPPAKLVQQEHNGNVGTAGVANLLAHIRKISDAARRKFRKGAILGPIMATWEPKTFAKFDEVVQASLKAAAIPDLKLSKADAKAMLRWRMRLRTKALNEKGFYDLPPVVPEELLQYLASTTVGMTDEVFDQFIVALRSNIRGETAADEQKLAEFRVAAKSATLTTSATQSEQQHHQRQQEEIEQLMIAVEQRHLLELFFELDVKHAGTIPLASALRLMVSAGVIQERSIARAMYRYKFSSTKQPGEVFLERQEKEEAQKRKDRQQQGDNSNGDDHHSLERRRSSFSGFGDSLTDSQLLQQHPDEDLEKEEDPPVSFRLFVLVVREPLKAVLPDGRTMKKLCCDTSKSEESGDAREKKNVFEPVFVHHDEFLARVKKIREMWKDKQ